MIAATKREHLSTVRLLRRPDAVLAHLDLNSKQSIGMHFGSVQLTDEGIAAPLEDLEIAKKKYNQQNFTTLKSGEDITL